MNGSFGNSFVFKSSGLNLWALTEVQRGIERSGTLHELLSIGIGCDGMGLFKCWRIGWEEGRNLIKISNFQGGFLVSGPRNSSNSWVEWIHEEESTI